MEDPTEPVLPEIETPRSRTSTIGPEKKSCFVCNICNQTYTRVDHLSRHHRSHTREKPFSCSLCGKNFARTDLLKRHAAGHSGASRRQIQSSTQNTRVAQACTACAVAKLRCGDEKPCRRCQQKGIECAPSHHVKQHFSKNSRSRITPSASDSVMDGLDPGPQEQFLMGLPEAESYTQISNSLARTSSTGDHFDPTVSMISGQIDVDPTLALDDSSLAEFLQDIMTRGSPNFPEDSPSINLLPQIDKSWDVLDFSIDSNFDFDDMDLSWMTSLSQANAFSYNNASEYDAKSLDTGQKTPDTRPVITLGAEAFQRSLWNWAPGNREHGWMELPNLSLPYKDMEMSENRRASDITEPGLDQSSRDAILGMVLNTNSQEGGTPPFISSFPSAQQLNVLMHNFFHSERPKTDSWIHLPTFRPRTQIPQLNGIVIATGAIMSSVPTVRKLGYAIQETVRIGMPTIDDERQFEKDNSRTRELQVLQTYALELQIGLWSGNKRKTEIAESHAQPVVTMMRRAGRFRRSRIPHRVPLATDDDETLEDKWKVWVEAESFKRSMFKLAFHLLIHDAEASISLLTRPLISYTEVSLELPCADSLWQAKTAQDWRTVYLQNPEHSARFPSLINCVHDMSPLVKYQNVVDVQYSGLIILHAIWSLIAEYRGLEFVLKLPTQERHWNGGLLSSSWHQELVQLLDHFSITVTDCSGGMPLHHTMLKELFLMNLHVSFEELQLFAGKEGNEEAQRVYPHLKVWFENRKSRQAIWHAGQVIRAALAFPPNQLRDFYAVALYHASLAIWVYGMVSLGYSRSRSRNNANRTVHNGRENELIYIDGDDTAEARRWIALSRGAPAIQDLLASSSLQRDDQSNQLQCARLENPKAVMEVVIDILSRNCTSGPAGLAPLIENLAQLMRDLGNAARIVQS